MTVTTFLVQSLLQSNYFNTSVSSEQLCFQNSYFFRTKLLLRSYFLRIGSSLGLLLFWSSYLLVEELLQNKNIYRRATFSKQVLLDSINFFRKTRKGFSFKTTTF